MIAEGELHEEHSWKGQTVSAQWEGQLACWSAGAAGDRSSQRNGLLMMTPQPVMTMTPWAMTMTPSLMTMTPLLTTTIQLLWTGSKGVAAARSWAT